MMKLHNMQEYSIYLIK